MLDALKATMGSAAFSAQYQQAPIPAGGALIGGPGFGATKSHQSAAAATASCSVGTAPPRKAC